MLPRLAVLAARAGAFLRRAATAAVGDVSWQPPAWLRALATSVRARPLRPALGLLLLLTIGFGGRCAYRHRPIPVPPRCVHGAITSPEVSPLFDPSDLSRLTVHFDASAAALSLLDQPLGPGLVRLDPPLPGVWRWLSDRSLVFLPVGDWPPGQAYRVTVSPAALGPHVLLATHTFDAFTPAFKVSLENLEFYQDPTDASIRQVTARLVATHPVDLAELERHLSLAMLGGSPVFGAPAPAKTFTLLPGRRRREFFLRSVPLTLPAAPDTMKLRLAAGVTPLQSTNATATERTATVGVPALDTLLRIESASTRTVKDKDGNPEQLLFVETSCVARSEDVAKFLAVYVLPADNPARRAERQSAHHAATDNDDGNPDPSTSTGAATTRNPQPATRDPQPSDDQDPASASADAGDHDSDPPDDSDGLYHTAPRPHRHRYDDDDDDGEDRHADSNRRTAFTALANAAGDPWSPDEVDAPALARSRRVPVTVVPSVDDTSTTHTFRLRADQPGFLFVKINQGLPAPGNYTLRDDFESVVPVPIPDQEVTIQGDGGLLALSGERKLSIQSRGVPAIRYEIARVPAAEINHLASQTEGNFQNPGFRDGYFNEQDLARISTETQTLNLPNPVQANYSSFDFTAHLQPTADGSLGREGLFFLTASGYDPEEDKYLEKARSARFVLVTDLGLLVKRNADGSRDVFAASLGHGTPLGQVSVTVLARNGAVLADALTDDTGRASLPSLGQNPRDSREPVAIVARLGDDVSFLPYERRDRELDFSRFATDGVQNRTGHELGAFVFTERGVYRPGDTLHVGVIVKQRDWNGALDGLPLETEVVDAREQSVQVKPLTLSSTGFVEWTFDTTHESPTGGYTLNVYLLRNGERGTLLGSTTVQVKEFLPDRLKLDVSLSKTSGANHGWVTPDDLHGTAVLQNLYGTAAENRVVKSHLRLNPRGFSFKEYPDYTFFDPLHEAKKDWEGETVDLGSRQTAADGTATFDFDLHRFADATYRLTFDAEGFEAEGGRGVEDLAGTLVSPLPSVVGWHADGDLHWIKSNGPSRTVNFLAIDPTLKQLPLENLTLHLAEEQWISVLTKDESGSYRYESVRREKPLHDEPFPSPSATNTSSPSAAATSLSPSTAASASSSLPPSAPASASSSLPPLTAANESSSLSPSAAANESLSFSPFAAATASPFDLTDALSKLCHPASPDLTDVLSKLCHPERSEERTQSKDLPIFLAAINLCPPLPSLVSGSSSVTPPAPPSVTPPDPLFCLLTPLLPFANFADFARGPQTSPASSAPLISAASSAPFVLPSPLFLSPLFPFAALRTLREANLPSPSEPTTAAYTLPNSTPGTFLLELRNASAQVVSRLEYTVVGQGEVTRSLEKNAELEIHLDRDQYNADDEIEIAVTSPYTGSGLITLERERVYAHRWFKATGTSSVQKIKIPPDFDGTGYVNVSFVRALDSKEIFMSPLSYAVAPFTANLEHRRLHVDLHAAEKTKPGDPLTIHYRTDRPAKIAVFAVDQGILQVTKQPLPDPLAYQFRKSALTVHTSQIVDLLLPEFSLLRAAQSTGGDGDPGVLNPFRRVTEKPVVYWSGILDADATDRTVTYEVPDYFSGTLTLMAVAVSPDALGSVKTSTVCRNPFVLTPGVPTLAAPGDEFEVGLTVANGSVGSGPDARIKVEAEPGPGLQILRAPTEPLRVPEGREASTVFRVKALDHLGSATLGFRASGHGEDSHVHATVSIRPAMPFRTVVTSGRFTGPTRETPVQGGDLYAEYRHLETTVSTLPLGLARGLAQYLKEYPHGCSEQLTSGAFARLALAGEPDFGLSRADAAAQIEHTISIERRRQNDTGGFGFWDSSKTPDIDFVTAYVMHFLSEAKADGYPVPDDMFQKGLGALRRAGTASPWNLQQARTQAYALYVLTREGIVTTNQLLTLRDYLDTYYKAQWPHDLTAVYLAGCWSLLKKDDEARRLIDGYQLGRYDARERWDFYQPLVADAQYVTMLARHFPDKLKRLTNADFSHVTAPIGEGDFSTLSAAYAVLALKAYSQASLSNPPHLSATALVPPGSARAPRAATGALTGGSGTTPSTGSKTSEQPLTLEGTATRFLRGAFPPAATALRFRADGGSNGFGVFFQTAQSGFAHTLPLQPVSRGIEVFRDILDPDSGQPTNRVKLGDRVTVRLRLRAVRSLPVTNVAVLDLLPGGFEVADDSLQPGVGTAGMDYVDVREDRAVFYGTVTNAVHEITYRLKATARGEFTVPPIFAESMYDKSIQSVGLAGHLTVTDAK